MILTGPEIQRQVLLESIDLQPFSLAQVNPNSYDVRLGDTILTYKNRVLDARRDNPTLQSQIPPEGAVLQSDRIYLGHTVERIGSDRFVPIVRAKSSVARLGLFIHVTADLIDIGSHGQLTLQLHAVQPVRVYPKMLIAQVTFWTVQGKIELYSGKYQGSTGPVPSQAFQDFD